MSRGKNLAGIVFAGAVLAPFAVAQAAIVTYVGPNVTYQYDDSQAAVAYFGLPGFIGDDVIFSPTVFRADSISGVGVHTGTNIDAVNATFVFDKIMSNNPSNEIISIQAYEEGDYRIVNDGWVNGDLYLLAKGLNNLLEPAATATDNVYASGDSAGNQLWSMSATVLPSASLSQLANNLRLTVQNDLSAFTDAGAERAWIEKKLVLNITTVVPVPAAVWLFGSALGLIGLVRRRLA
ncbi:MAG: VPLPA-CTERM sorting domain-containing protein [Gammaproteobacteria bacterium]|nr:VPLPA-CTERM sorting domain-containing protein [Gammaproteobacteria bacterium]